MRASLASQAAMPVTGTEGGTGADDDRGVVVTISKEARAKMAGAPSGPSAELSRAKDPAAEPDEAGATDEAGGDWWKVEDPPDHGPSNVGPYSETARLSARTPWDRVLADQADATSQGGRRDGEAPAPGSLLRMEA